MLIKTCFLLEFLPQFKKNLYKTSTKLNLDSSGERLKTDIYSKT